MLKIRISRWAAACVMAGLAVSRVHAADEPVVKAEGGQTETAASGPPVSVQSGAVQVQAGPVEVRVGEKKSDDQGSEKSTEVKAGPVTVRVHTHSNSDSGASGEARRIVSGRVVVIGPDGKSREFELGQGIPNDLKIFLGNAGVGGGRTFSLNIGDGSGRITSRHESDVTVINKGEDDSPKAGNDDKALTEAESQAPEVERLMLGVHCREADSLLRSQLKLGDRGLVVIEVVEDSPAAAAGLQKDDLLLKAGDSELKLIPDLLDAVQKNGEKELALQVLRQGDPLTLTATPKLMKEPKQVVITLGTGDSEGKVFNWLGEGKLPPELHQHLMNNKVQLHLRHIHPGVMIEKGTSPEEIQRLLDKALHAEQKDIGADVKAGQQPSDDKSLNRVSDQLDELTKQLQVLSDRLSRLEEKK